MAGPNQIRSLSARDRLRQVPWVIQRAIVHPTWMAEHVRMARARSGGSAANRAEPYEPSDLPVFESATEALGSIGVEVGGRRAESSVSANGDGPAFNDADPVLAETLATIIGDIRPGAVIETGVARGVSSAQILAQLAENDHGHLFSIDLPTLRPDARTEVGVLVPSELRDRWTLHLGPSRRLLPKVLGKVGDLDLFFHDADHSYDAQSLEYGQAWPYLRAGGFLVSDDVDNPAFEELAVRTGADAVLIRASSKQTLIGVARKPGDL